MFNTRDSISKCFYFIITSYIKLKKKEKKLHLGQLVFMFSIQQFNSKRINRAS